MICFPNAKLNLGLHIVSKRADGYHDIETIFYPIPIKDALEIVPAPSFEFHQSGIPIEAPTERNLVVKALRLLEEKYNIPPLSIYLRKEIPFGAGLGGGSSDGAHLLKLVSSFCQFDLSDDDLETMATRLGADCPFFIRNIPVFASGIGNRFEAISISLKSYYLCLVCPDIMVSTREAYAGVEPSQPMVSLKETITRPIEEWREKMVNDFERTVFQSYPLLKEIKEQLYAWGALYAAMSGSGSSLFGIFEHPTQLKTCFPHYFVWEGSLQ